MHYEIAQIATPQPQCRRAHYVGKLAIVAVNQTSTVLETAYPRHLPRWPSTQHTLRLPVQHYALPHELRCRTTSPYLFVLLLRLFVAIVGYINNLQLRSLLNLNPFRATPPRNYNPQKLAANHQAAAIRPASQTPTYSYDDNHLNYDAPCNLRQQPYKRKRQSRPFCLNEMSLYRGYFSPNGVDPNGSVVIYVHGIGPSQHRLHSPWVHQGLKEGWFDNGKSYQALIHFVHGPTNFWDAWYQSTERNIKAADRLAALVRDLQNERRRLECDEPIFIYAYSNGSIVTTLALEAGMQVDGVVFAGAALENDHDMTEALENTPFINSYWSKQDGSAGWADGAGRYGFANEYDGLNDYERINIEHYYDDDERTASLVGRRRDGKSEWDSRYMAINDYSTDLSTDVECCISEKGVIFDQGARKMFLGTQKVFFYDSWVR